MFILLLTLIAAAVIYLFKGGLPWNRDGSTDNISPTPSGQVYQPGSSSEQPTPTPEPTPWPTPEPMPEESTDTAILKVSWQTPAVFDGPNAFPDSAAVSPDGRIMFWVFQNYKPVTGF